MIAHFPSDASWVHPGGGFFIWVRLAEGTDSEALLRRAIEEQKTAFVAGPPFFPDGGGSNYLRLSYSFVREDQIEEAIRRLSRAMSD